MVLLAIACVAVLLATAPVGIMVGDAPRAGHVVRRLTAQPHLLGGQPSLVEELEYAIAPAEGGDHRGERG